MKPILKIKSKTDRAQDQYKTNEKITTLTGSVRVVDPESGSNTEMLLQDALKLARDKDLDLVQISMGNMPVCKLVKFDKFIYNLKKQQKANAQHAKKNKLIKFSPVISDHDLEHKIKHIKEFITDGFKVELYLRFHGRQQAHKEFGHAVFQKVISETSSIAKIESPLKDNGNNLTMMLGKK